MADFKISSPNLRVWRGDLAAPECLEVQTLNPDLVAWDMTRAKHRWPNLQDAPMKWLTFIGWHAARRTGAIPTDLTFEAWESSVLTIDNLDAEEDTEVSDPSLSDLAPG